MVRATPIVFLLALTATCCSALASSSTNNRLIQLKYFDARGAAETSRILLALGEEPYDDIRFELIPGQMESPAFSAAKENGELLMNLNRAPVLITKEGGVTIGQSKAIERYLARRFGLMGSSSEEEALIDCIGEHCRDVRDAQARKGFSMFTPGKSEDEKAQLRKEWFTQDMPAMLQKVEAVVQKTGSVGCAVGDKLSLADVAIFSLLRDCYPPDQAEVNKASKDCNALNAIADGVAKDPRVAKWLEVRPPSNF